MAAALPRYRLPHGSFPRRFLGSPLCSRGPFRGPQAQLRFSTSNLALALAIELPNPNSCSFHPRGNQTPPTRVSSIINSVSVRLKHHSGSPACLLPGIASSRWNLFSPPVPRVLSGATLAAPRSRLIHSGLCFSQPIPSLAPIGSAACTAPPLPASASAHALPRFEPDLLCLSPSPQWLSIALLTARSSLPRSASLWLLPWSCLCRLLA
jgi:hypothetical protein